MPFQAGAAYVPVNPDFKGWDSSVRRQMASPALDQAASAAGERSGESFRSRFAGRTKLVAAALTTAFGGVAIAAVKTGVQTAAGLETANIAFTTMLGSASKARDFLGKLQKFAADTPFDLPGLQKSAQSLISIGIDADKVIPIMTSLGNATAGMGTGAEGVQRATRAIQQMNAAGKISAEDFNQLQDAGIPVYELLAKATGKSTAAIAKMRDTGKLGRKELELLMKALENGKGLERFNGMMDKQSQTLSGLWSTLKDTLSNSLAEVVQPLIPLLKEGLGGAISFVAAKAPILATWLKNVADSATLLWAGLTMDAGTRAEFDGQLEGLVAKGAQIRATFDKVKDGAQGLYAILTKGDYTAALRRAFGWEEDSDTVGRILTYRTAVLNAKDAIKGLFQLVVRGDYTSALRKAFGWEEDNKTVDKILEIRDAVTKFFAGLRQGDFSPISAVFAKLLPLVSNVAATLPAMSGVVDTASTVFGFLADHIDLVTKAMPYLLSAFALYKTAQLANNVIGRNSLVGFGLQISSTLALAAANRALVNSQKSLAVSQGLQTGAQNASIFTTVRQAAATAATTIAQKAASVATKAWAATQWLLNAALNANPIGLIVAGLAALAGGLYLAWTHSETFRNIVMGAWNGIKAAAGAVVSWFTTSVWPVLQSGITLVTSTFQSLWGTVQSVFGLVAGKATWLWTTILQPVFGAIGNVVGKVLGTAFNIWWGVVSRVFTAVQILALALWKGLSWVFDQAKTGLGWVGDKFVWLYEKAVKPVMGWVVSAAKTMWSAVKAIFTYLKSGVQGMGDKFRWFYDSIIKPVFGWIGGLIGDWWKHSVLPVVNFWKTAFGQMGSKLSSFWTVTVKPVFTSIGTHIKAVWDNTINKVFTALKKGVGLVTTAFETAKKGIGVAWGALEELAKKPVRFVINTVLNKGLIGSFNWLAGKIGGPKIAPIPLPFKTGGVLPGYTPGRDVHRFTSPTGGTLDLSGGEAVMRPEWTRMIGGPREVARQNDAARRGMAFKDGGVIGTPTSHAALADGGIIGWIKSKAASAFDWVKDKTSAIWKAISNPIEWIKSRLPSIPGGEMVTNVGKSIVTKGLSLAGDKIKSLFSVFNGGYDKVEAARAAAGVGGAAGIPPGTRGLTLRPGVRLDADTMRRVAVAAGSVAMRVIQGSWQDYYLSGGTHRGAGAADIHAASWAGGVTALRRQGMLAMFRNWAGNQHIHAINPNIGGLSPQAQAQVRQARANNGNFAGGGLIPRLYDQGGILPPGLTLVSNRTRKPEVVLPPNYTRDPGSKQFIFQGPGWDQYAERIASEVDIVQARRDALNNVPF